MWYLGVKGLTRNATKDWAKRWGYKSCQNPLPSFCLTDNHPMRNLHKLSSHTNLIQVTKVKPWSWEFGIRTNMPTVRRWPSRLNVWRPNIPTAAHRNQILLLSPVLGIIESRVCGGYSINKVVWCREIPSNTTLWRKVAYIHSKNFIHQDEIKIWHDIFCCHRTVPWSWVWSWVSVLDLWGLHPTRYVLKLGITPNEFTR